MRFVAAFGVASVAVWGVAELYSDEARVPDDVAAEVEGLLAARDVLRDDTANTEYDTVFVLPEKNCDQGCVKDHLVADGWRFPSKALPDLGVKDDVYVLVTPAGDFFEGFGRYPEWLAAARAAPTDGLALLTREPQGLDGE